MKAVGYCRVSTDKQDTSLEAQEVKIRAMVAVKDLELLDVIVDSESAKSLDRPGMDRLLAMVEAKQVDCVIIAKLDRLTRSVKDLGTLLDHFQRRQVSLVSVAESLDTGSAAGRLVLNIMASVSQWEREAIGERTRDVLRHKRSKRQAYSHTPYGFDRQGNDLTPSGTETEVVSRIRGWKAAGLSLRAIAGHLTSEGISTKTGKSWHASTVRAILANPLHSQAAA